MLTVESSANGAGPYGGSQLRIGRNSSGSGAAGALGLTLMSGTLQYVWSDSSGLLRINGNAPTEDGTGSTDTGGTIVGTQTSMRSTKNIYGEFTDYAGALKAILAAPLWDFDYKAGSYNGQRFVGITTDDSPLFGMDGGRSFNPVTAFGYTVAAFKELERRLADAEATIATLTDGVH
jgi:hypothetical protein